MLVIPLDHYIPRFDSYIIYFASDESNDQEHMENEIANILPKLMPINDNIWTIELTNVVSGKAFLIKNPVGAKQPGLSFRPITTHYLKAKYDEVLKYFQDNPDLDVPAREINLLFRCGHGKIYQVLNKLLEEKLIYKFFHKKRAFFKLK